VIFRTELHRIAKVACEARLCVEPRLRSRAVACALKKKICRCVVIEQIARTIDITPELESVTSGRTGNKRTAKFGDVASGIPTRLRICGRDDLLEDSTPIKVQSLRAGQRSGTEETEQHRGNAAVLPETANDRIFSEYPAGQLNSQNIDKIHVQSSGGGLWLALLSNDRMRRRSIFDCKHSVSDNVSRA
jgi:hypothetical protein